MIKFATTLIFVDKKENVLRFNINAESPEEAAISTYEREDDLKPRPAQIGDAVIVANPDSSFTGYYIYDIPNAKDKEEGRSFSLRQVQKAELDFWRRMMGSNSSRTQGVDVALPKVVIT